MSAKVVARLQAQFGARILATSNFRGDDTAVVAPKDWREAAQFLKTDAETACDQFIDLIAYQKAYQANVKTITTADALLQEVFQLIR